MTIHTSYKTLFGSWEKEFTQTKDRIEKMTEERNTLEGKEFDRMDNHIEKQYLRLELIRSFLADIGPFAYLEGQIEEEN